MGGAYNSGTDPTIVSDYYISLFAINQTDGSLEAYAFNNPALASIFNSYSFVTNMYLDAASYSIFFSTGVRAANFGE